MSDVFALTFRLYVERKMHIFITLWDIFGVLSLQEVHQYLIILMWLCWNFKVSFKNMYFFFPSCIPVCSEFNWMAVYEGTGLHPKAVYVLIDGTHNQKQLVFDSHQDWSRTVLLIFLGSEGKKCCLDLQPVSRKACSFIRLQFQKCLLTDAKQLEVCDELMPRSP